MTYKNEIKKFEERAQAQEAAKKVNIKTSRHLPESKSTRSFMAYLRKLDRNHAGRVRIQTLSDFLEVDERTVRNWEKAKLIFPMRKSRQRFYYTKDIIRGITIKYLSADMGIKYHRGIMLVLQTVKEIVSYKYTSNTEKGLDDDRIDRYILSVCNFDITKLGGLNYDSHEQD